jgi:hypothetical protein
MLKYESWNENDFLKSTNVQRKVDDWPFKEGVRLVGFKYQKGYDWLNLNWKQERVRLVGFKYQKIDNWLDTKFHCSYQESRGVSEKKNRGKYGRKHGK